MDKYINVDVNADGTEVTVEAEGFQGVGCREKTADYNTAFSSGQSKETLKPEFDQIPVAAPAQRVCQ